MAERQISVLHVSARDFSHSGAWSEDESSRWESTTTSTTSESRKCSGQCQVCGTTFKVTKRRYRCGVCGNSVCHAHARKKTTGGGNSIRVCDLCARKPLEGEVRLEMGDPIELYKQRLKRLYDERVAIDQSIIAKNSEISEIQRQAELQSRKHEEELKEIKGRVDEEVRLRMNKKSVVKHLQEIVLTSQAAETAQSEKMHDSEKIRSEAKDTVQQLHSEIEEAEALIAHYTLQLQGRLHMNEAKRQLCESCRDTVTGGLNPRTRVPSLETSMAKKQPGKRQ